ncbi:MAG: metallophosphoesterase [Cellulosilyticaceae bacterium]
MKKLAIGLGCSVGSLVLYSLLEPYRQRVKKYAVKSNNLPKSFEGFKIIFLADIHYGRTIRKKRMRNLINRINGLEPDLILLGGDYVISKKYIKPCFEMLSHLKSAYGTYAVVGNHDVEEGLGETMRAMKKAGIISISNDAIWLGEFERIRIGGVGDLRTQKQILEPTLKGVKEDDFVLLVSHNPRYVYQLGPEVPIDLVLAGHTHGGQFAPIKHLGYVTPRSVSRRTGIEFLSGRKKSYHTDVIVSNGIGTAKFALRLGALPEIVEITLHSEGKY